MFRRLFGITCKTLSCFIVFILILAAFHYTKTWADSFYEGDRSAYLQLPTPNAMTVRWVTHSPQRGVVLYGTQTEAWSHKVTETQPQTDHEVRLTSLTPATRYYYRVTAKGHTELTITEGSFTTPPKSGANTPVRMLIIGDAGDANPTQNSVKQAALNWLDQHRRVNLPVLDLFMTTGDNAYKSGSNFEFQTGFFTPYGDILKQVPVWPVYGNHDARGMSFHSIFSFPTQGEAGGVPSGTEEYYSFNYGPLHVVVLDSQTRSSSEPTSDMLNWLERDLAASQHTWVITAFHHPPYTQGSHNSDDPSDSKGRLFKVREHIVPLLEKYGVDLVLTGHTHMYERSGLLNCHYGVSNTLQKTSRLDYAPNSVYRKQASAREPHQGTMYAVVGSSAKVDQGLRHHPAMQVSLEEAGSLVVDVDNNVLQGNFIGQNGTVLDHFKIIKNASQGIPFGNECNSAPSHLPGRFALDSHPDKSPPS